MYADSGVIGYDADQLNDKELAEFQANKSAVPHAGNSFLLENETATKICPEGGYVKMTYPQAVAVMEQLELSIETKAADDTNYTFVARCLYAEEAGNSTDRNTVMEFFTEHPGRLHLIRYPVNPACSGFYSAIHLSEDLANGHGNLRANADNCGNSGCKYSYVIAIDFNHKTITIELDTVENGRELVYSNAVQP